MSSPENKRRSNDRHLPPDDFLWKDGPEPHSARRRSILAAHPEVKRLMRHEWRSKYVCVLLLVLPQLWLSVATTELSWAAYLAVAYVVGATIAQALFLAVHELSHNLFFREPSRNRAFAMLVNLPIGIPFCVAFRGYHLEHHKWQGVDGVDTDLPSRLEGRLVRSAMGKAAWMSLQIVAYALRPTLTRRQPVTSAHVANWALQIGFDVALVYLFGWAPLLYLLLCVLLAGGLHPCAGHFVSEHYVFPHLDATQETYSYYGPLNLLTWNVGYHNEHHDFPNVPWSGLPHIRRIAPEHYDQLRVCRSWVGVILDFVLRDEVGPYSRVKRRR